MRTDELHRFRDRREAGQVLAGYLDAYARRQDVIVLALPRGGVPVGFEIAAALHAPLDVFVIRKLGVPWHQELAMGAIASGGVRVINDEVVHMLHVPPAAIDQVVAEEQRELERRERLYRDDQPFPDISGKVAILVDDGLATGSSMRAAVRALRQHHPARIVIATPVGAPDTCAAFRDEVDEVVCAMTPEFFQAVGLWYEQFDQTSDQEVRDLLAQRTQLLAERGV
jgi:putative phosphoribosyl transferase